MVKACQATTMVLASGGSESLHFGSICMADVQHLFTLYWHRFPYADPMVVMCDGGKSGVAIISMVVNDYCHKLMKKELAEDWFGVERIQVSELLEVKKEADGPENMVDTHAERDPGCLFTSSSGGSLPVPGPSATRSSQSLIKHKEKMESAMDSFENAMVGPKSKEIARKKAGVKSTPLGIGVVATYHHPSVEFLEWGRHCGFCGSSGHLLFKDTDPLSCSRAKRRVLADGTTMGLTAVCSYSRCTIRHLHTVKVCPVLHHLCSQ